MKFNVSYLTNKGLERESNEDAILILDEIIQAPDIDTPINRIIEEPKAIFAIADGIGGYEGGEFASRIVLEVFSQRFLEINNYYDLEEAIKIAHNKLIEFSKHNIKYNKLGTTISGLIFFNSIALCFNMGDSRVYRINSSFLEQISKDHSIVQQLIDKGIIGYSQAMNHPKRNIIYSYIGVDLYEKNFDIYCKDLSIKEGDVFIICSDGLTDILNIEELESCLDDKIDLTINNFYNKVLEKGANDNLSIIIVKILNL